MAVLNGDKIVKDLVAISFYDSKPVYFFSAVIPEVNPTVYCIVCPVGAIVFLAMRT